MSWKIFITAFISTACISFPQNIIGCGPSPDPYDYYTSFFSKEVSDAKGYKPFYYSSLLEFYDDWDYDTQRGYEEDKIIQEWKQYCNVSTSDAVEFIYNTTAKDVKQLVEHLAKNTALSLPDSIRKNGMTKCLLEKKNGAALSYLEFAKSTEKFSAAPDWENPADKDSIALNKFITEADKKYKETPDAFLKDKWAFQRCKLAFYNNRFSDCIRWYDEHFKENNSSAVNGLALSYKAGSFFRSGKKNEAAYYFSKAFPLSNKKKENFLGFFWATNNASPELKNDFLKLCKNDKERAAMLSMFSLHGTAYSLADMEKVYALDPSSSLLPILAIREINKIEEQYYTPLLQKQKGGKALYLSWAEESDDIAKDKNELKKTISFFKKLGENKAVVNGPVYVTGAAYLSFINGDYSEAKDLLAKTRSLSLNQKLTDQVQLISLLIMANEGGKIDAVKEQEILSSVQWLTNKAKDDTEFRLFCRNFFSEILAQRYEQQGDAHKAALAYGVADLAFINQKEGEYIYSYPPGIAFIRNEMNTAQLLKLHELFTTDKKSSFDQFLAANSSFKTDAVIDVIGTSYLREADFTKAIEWFKKAGKPELMIYTQYNYKTDKETVVNVDPFHDYLNDWNRFDKTASKPYNKLTLTQKLLETQKSIDTAKNAEAKSKLFYKLASAFYNMSYYGNSWKAVAYERSSVDWNTGKYDAEWKKEYFGVYKAKDLYQKAYELTKNKEFKAAALFMVAKCAQRQIPMPDYNYNNYEQYEKDLAAFEVKFKNNPVFSKFKTEFGTTQFYKYTYSRCSYLRDFVTKQSATKPKKN